MIIIYNFTLGNFWYLNKVNSFFIRLLHEHIDFFNEKDIKFINIDGAFPQSYWQSAGLSKEEFADYSTIINYYNQYPIGQVVDCSNPLLTDYDLKDSQMELILRSLDNGENCALISSHMMLDFFKINYPNYRLIFNNHYCAEDINKFNLEDFYKIRLTMNSTLENVTKNKQQICVCSCCLNCNKNKECFLKDCKNIIEFRTRSEYEKCNKVKYFVTPWTDIEKYHKKGYNDFYFDFKFIYSGDIAFQIYLQTFIKPEFQKDAFLMFLQGE